MATSPEELLANALEARNAEAATAIRDGRRMRAERGRAAVLSAAYELVNSGVNPTIADIAEKAGVSERTVFRYYADREALLAGVSAELIVLIAPYIDATRPDGDFDARLSELLRRRLELVRIGGAFAVMLDRWAHDSELAADLQRLRLEQLREQVRNFLSPECEGENAFVLPVLYALLEHTAIRSLLDDSTEVEVFDTLRRTFLRLLGR